MAHEEEHEHDEDEIEDEGREEEAPRVRREVVLPHEVGDEDAVDAQRGERSGESTVDDEEARHEDVEPVAAGEAEGERRDDRDREECAEGDEHRGEEEEHPRCERRAAGAQAQTPVDEDVDRPVVLCETEEEREADEGDEHVDRESRKCGPEVHTEHPAAERNGAEEPEQTHVHPSPRGEDEHDDEDEERDDLGAHGEKLSVTTAVAALRWEVRGDGPLRDRRLWTAPHATARAAGPACAVHGPNRPTEGPLRPVRSPAGLLVRPGILRGTVTVPITEEDRS